MLLLAFFWMLKAYGQEIDTSLWIADAPVSVVARSGNAVYIGGDFNYVGPSIGNAATVDKVTGKLSSQSFPYTNGEVLKFLSDERGGWYIMGYFTKVQGISQKYLAHILPNNSLDTTWRPDVGEGIYLTSMILNKNVLFVGGVAPESKISIASVSLNNGHLTSWLTDMKGSIKAMAVRGDTLFTAGYFSESNGQPFTSVLNAYYIPTQQLFNWNPIQNGIINDLLISGNRMFLAGDISNSNPAFISFNSFDFIYVNLDNLTLSKLEVAVGDIPFNPYRMLLSGNKIYIGGGFENEVLYPNSNKLAVIDLTSNRVSPLLNSANGRVTQLALSGDTLFFTGAFDKINFQERKGRAAISLTRGLTDWDPGSSFISAIACSKNGVLVSGNNFATIGVKRNKLAALNAKTGQVLEWNPEITPLSPTNGQTVKYIAPSPDGQTIYIAGNFAKIGGKDRTNLAAVTAVSGQVTDWNPGNIIINSPMFIKRDVLYAIGNSSSASGLLNLDLFTGKSSGLPLQTGGPIYDIFLAGDTLYLRGDFNTVEGQPHRHLASIRLSNQKLLDWAPVYDDTDANYTSMMVYKNTFYLGGIFKINGVNTPIIAFDTQTGRPSPWTYKGQGEFARCMAAGNNKLYFCLSGIKKNVSYSIIEFVSPETGNILQSISTNDYAEKISVYGKAIYMAGYLNFEIKNKKFQFITAFGTDTTNYQPVIEKLNVIKGTVFLDINKNCIQDSSEPGIPNITIKVEPINYFTNTDDQGKYILRVDTGSFKISQVLPTNIIPAPIIQICPTNAGAYPVRFNAYNNEVSDKNFSNQLISCPSLSVNVSCNARRRCFQNYSTISYLNRGVITAFGVKIYVKLPEYVVFKSADKPFTKDKNGNYIFDLGNVEVNQSGVITIKDSVSCLSNITGLTQCTKVWVPTINSCNSPNPDYDNSDIFLSGKCLDNGVIRMGIYNKGSGNMKDSAQYRVFIDAQLAFKRNFKLVKNDSLILKIPANGRTIRLEADEPKNHPSKESTNLSIENCGSSPNTLPSRGFVTKLPQDDTQPEVAIQCLPITDSRDPNDKQVLPTGTTTEHFTPTDAELQYQIRFHNTGTDTAYTATVIDTLSDNLDVATLQIGAASHKYLFNVSGKGKPVLTWTMNNINLPDSTKDRLNSNGFVSFSIKAKTGLPTQTKIENYADIIFDFNDPVRTNTTFNVMYDVPPVVVNAVKLDEKAITPLPIITSFSPTKAKVGETITLKGKNFEKNLAENILKISTVQAIVESANDSILVFKVPAGALSGKINLKTNYGLASSSTDFIVLYPPLIASFSPEKGIPGDKIIITGSNFDAIPANNTVKFGSLAAQVLSANATTLEVKVPSGFYQAKVAVNTPVGSTVSTTDFTMLLTATENLSENNLAIYPNPTDGKIMIDFGSQPVKVLEISVWNSIGSQVLLKNIQKTIQTEELDLLGKPAGLYLLFIKTDKNLLVKKVMLK